jgi:hypothetical protein
MGNPTLLSMPLCVNADKNTIPSTDAGTSGLFSEEKGFQTINSLPLTAGGKAPARQDFNAIFALLGGIDYMAQRGYTFEFDNTLPYVVGCIVLDTDGKLYRCINDVSAGASNPSQDAVNWMPYDCLPLDGGGALTGTSLTWNGNDLGNSAIIAQHIPTNKDDIFYIKFANGLIVQGALLGNSGQGGTVTFPISFRSNLPGGCETSAVIMNSTGTQANPVVTSSTPTGFTYTKNYYWAKWVAIGF